MRSSIAAIGARDDAGIQKENFDPGIHVIAIGVAGENQVRFSNLMTDLGRAAGRTGQGAGWPIDVKGCLVLTTASR